jgi:hypothetical protein
MDKVRKYNSFNYFRLSVTSCYIRFSHVSKGEIRIGSVRTGLCQCMSVYVMLLDVLSGSVRLVQFTSG